MIPLHELLSRIHWDPEFGKGRFVIGYEDHDKRAGRRIVHVDLSEVRPDPENRFMLDIRDEEDAIHSIPLHRVKQVFKDGVLIWERAH